MERHRNGEACVVPVILRPVEWQRCSFAGLQVLPTGGKAITEWGDHDEAFTNVATGIRDALDGLRNAAALATSSNATDTDAQHASTTRTVDVELTLDRDFESFADSDKRRLLNAIAQLLRVGDVTVVRVRPGSVKLTLRLDPAKAEQLMEAVRDGALDKYDVVSAAFVDGAIFGLPPDYRNYIRRAAIEGEINHALSSGQRLVTVHGSGGSGKTSVAIACARAAVKQRLFPDAVSFVALENTPQDLDELLVRDFVVAEIAKTFGKSGKDATLINLLKWLEHRQVLLVLDCFEVVANSEIAELIRQFLRSTHKLQLLVTGRQLVGLDGEKVLNLDIPAYRMTPQEGSKLFLKVVEDRMGPQNDWQADCPHCSASC